MNNMKKILNKITIAAGICVAVSSCGFLDVDPQVILSDNFYNNEKEVQYGLAGVYGVLNNEAFYGNYYSLMYSNIDDLCYFNRDVASNFLQFNRHDAGTSQIYDMWVEIYQGVKCANSFMENVSVPEVKEKFDVDGKYYNEARFLRAYYHFILAQAWGDVPLIDKAYRAQNEDLMCKVTPQAEVLKWVISEMEACVDLTDESLENAPSRVMKTTVQGILARVCLFTAGESVNLPADEKTEFLTKAKTYADAVIKSEKHDLNPDYSQIFKNMIMDIYDKPSAANGNKTESMWEVDFLGDRSSADTWSNGRIGDVLGLQSSGDKGYDKFNCNFAYGQYNGSLQLWDLYWKTDRVAHEDALAVITDKRQEWNLPPYNYAGRTNQPPYGSGLASGESLASIDKAPYVYNKVSTSDDPTSAQAIRNCGKYRREVEYEGQKNAKLLYTTINYPILRYSDVLLMYAEASNELSGPTDEAYECVKKVRDRAGIQTIDMAEYNQETFRQLIRNERGRELCFESLRRYDLTRWGIYVDQMHNYVMAAADERWSKEKNLSARAATIGAAVQPRHIYLPIPSIELGVNKALVQNPLW